MKTKVISIMNSKGGVGKTITAANMAQILASEYGHRVLAIDLDPQADLTALLGLPVPMGDHVELEDMAGAYDLLTGGWIPGTPGLYPEDIIHHTRYTGLDLVPSCSQMLVLGLTSADDCTKRLSDFIAAVSEMDNPYHFIVIDCPPAFSGPSAAAIYCSDDVIIPTKLDYFGHKAAQFILEQIEIIAASSERELLPSVLVTMWHNSEVCKQGLSVLEKALPENVLLYPAMIRRSDKVDESTYYGQALGEYSRFSSAGRDYRDFVAQFLSVTYDGTLDAEEWRMSPNAI